MFRKYALTQVNFPPAATDPPPQTVKMSQPLQLAIVEIFRTLVNFLTEHKVFCRLVVHILQCFKVNIQGNAGQ